MSGQVAYEFDDWRDGAVLSSLLDLDVTRWDAALDDADEALLQRCHGPAIDIGCGPGRLVAALTTRGLVALGIDVAKWAVHSARTAGAAAMHTSVFEQVPSTGHWRTALLADGNVGIGGHPLALAERVAELLVPGGLVLCEVDAHDVDERMLMRLAALDGTFVAPVPWARVGLGAATEVFEGAGYAVEESWSVAGRCFLAARTAVTAASDAVATATTATLTRIPRG